jgi:hypothetical protein
MWCLHDAGEKMLVADGTSPYQIFLEAFLIRVVIIGTPKTELSNCYDLSKLQWRWHEATDEWEYNV